MIISELTNKYKNTPGRILINSLISLLIFPLLFISILKNFSGFGYLIINSQIIIYAIFACKILAVGGFCIPLTILIISKMVGYSRARIAFYFPILTSFTIYSLLAYIIFISLIFCFILFCLLNELTSFRPTLIILFIGISLIFIRIIPVAFQGIFKFTKEEDIYRIGIVLDKEKHKKFFDFVKIIANKINSRLPNNIVIGLTSDFYVVAKGMSILDGVQENKIYGETLYISIPFLRVLTINELRGILGHELGHFSGEDTFYAIKFAPVYRQLNDQFVSFDNELKRDNEFSKFISYIIIYPLIFLFNEFYKKDNAIRKMREYRADQIGSQSCSSAKDFINALFKIYVYSDVWDWVEKDHYELVRNKLKIDNINKAFIKKIKNKVDPDKIELYLKDYLQYQQKHPIDTHPTGLERMKNLKVKLKDINKETLTKLTPSSATLIKDLNLIEERLTYIINRVIEQQ